MLGIGKGPPPSSPPPVLGFVQTSLPGDDRREGSGAEGGKSLLFPLYHHGTGNTTASTQAGGPKFFILLFEHMIQGDQ